MVSDFDYDIAVIGAGPAGCSAAIYAALRGLKVALIESNDKPRSKPGESLPPGVESIFQQLGIWDDICKLKLIRNQGHYIYDEDSKRKLFHTYGQDKNGTWHGIQLPRILLDTILQKRAETLGIKLITNCHVKNLTIHNGKINLNFNEDKKILAKYYIDATGQHQLFSRKLGIEMLQCSPKLIVQFGYSKDTLPYFELPIFIKNKNGWRWYAKIDQCLYAWVRLGETKSKSEPYKKYDTYGGADVTWKIARQLANHRFFLAGDAACTLDPSAGHGVLRALMTGIMASHIIFNIVKNVCSESEGYRYYNKWLTNWFRHDMHELQKRF